MDAEFAIVLKGPNDKTITIADDRRYKKIETRFSWNEKDLIDPESEYHGKVQLSLITSATPISPSSGLRGLALFSRGKLVNMSEYFSDSTSSHFYQYLTCWIKADFIDLLDEDVISTNRQSLNWDHPEMAKFRAYRSALVSRVGQDWRKTRANKKEKELEQANVSGEDKDGAELGSMFGFQYDAPSKSFSKRPVLEVNDLSTDSLRNIQVNKSHLMKTTTASRSA